MRKGKRKTDKFYLIFYVVIALLCVILLSAKFTLHPISVVGQSMSPTYEDGDLLSSKPFEPETMSLDIDDIVVFRSGDIGKTLIKRVVAVSGDTVEVRDGYLYRNGEKVTDSFPQMEDAGLLASSYTVPEGMVIVLGDNRNHSSDSREFGAIDLKHVDGIITKILIGK